MLSAAISRLTPALVTRLVFHCLLIVCFSSLVAGCKGKLRPTHSDALKAFSELVDVQEAKQASFVEHALAAGPEFTEVVLQDTSFVLKGWRLRQMQFEYLIATNPERLRLRQGRDGLVYFDWTSADSLKLAAENPAYSRLATEVAELEGWVNLNKNNNPDVLDFYMQVNKTAAMRSLKRMYRRDEQAIVVRYRLAAILKEE